MPTPKSNAYHLKSITLTALLAALIAALTLFGKIPFPMTSEGSVHLGDGVVYIAACLLPGPYAAAAAAIGCGLADLPAAPAWLPATIVIKISITFLFSAKRQKLLCWRNALALPLAALINVGGYYLYEGAVLGEWGALLSVVGNVMQSCLAALIFVPLAAAMDQLRLKEKFLKWSK